MDTLSGKLENLESGLPIEVYNKLLELYEYAESKNDVELLQMFDDVQNKETIRKVFFGYFKDEEYAWLATEQEPPQLKKTLMMLYAQGKTAVQNETYSNALASVTSLAGKGFTIRAPEITVEIEQMPLDEKVKAILSKLNDKIEDINLGNPEDNIAQSLNRIFSKGETTGTGGTGRDKMSIGEHTITTIFTILFSNPLLLDGYMKELEAQENPEYDNLIKDCKSRSKEYVNLVCGHLQGAVSKSNLAEEISIAEFIKLFNKVLERAPEFGYIGVELPASN
ncbi:MAG: hypothetical protein ABI721_00770 [Candidatus Dojkabacteria bacterium]